MILHVMKWGVASTTALALMLVPAAAWAAPQAGAGQAKVSSAQSKKGDTVPVVVTNDTTQSVPVTVEGTPTVNVAGTPTVNIAGTPTVNAIVSGEVGIAGTPTVNANVSGSVGITGTPAVSVSGPVGVDVLSSPGVRAGNYTASCGFNGNFFCQATTTQQAPAGMAFKIEHITGETFNSSSASANIPARMSLNITTPGFNGPGLGTPFPVPCVMEITTALCTASPGIYVTSLGGFTFSAAQPFTGSARVTVYYTVVDLAQ